MTYKTAAQYWDDNATTWTTLARLGYDTYRDFINTPAFIKSLPDITGKYGLDIGCGEGHNTRLLAKAGAKMQAIDVSPIFINYASQYEQAQPYAIEYQVANAVCLPFQDHTFDFATAFMSLMDIPDVEDALKEAYRVLKPGGFLQFSITHPCFSMSHRENLRDKTGKTYAIEVGGYLNATDDKIERWTFSALPKEKRTDFPKFEIPVFHITLSDWLNTLIQTGFTIEYLNEPMPDDETVHAHPELQDAQVVAYFLHVRCRK